DFVYKYQGLSIYSEYANRWTNNANVVDVDGDVFGIYKGEGFSIQSGYLLENNIEPSARFSMIQSDVDVKGVKDQNHYTVGLSKYFNGHTVKLQGDLTYEETLASKLNKQDSAWVARLQLELGI